ncbi:MAG: bifunctional 3,4-dihydroxy-2-butanone-4-phosphate synthase/GTP cyclohydrolase II [Bacteroidales bacterium]|nr:bifunctional 3,4-dihydroxy-2-butanone-4-phosphate synthase/GTP cyclohydrolase II [Bacteroidales bacterium]
MKLNTIEELVEDIRAGRMVILMDDEDRENEGDLIMAAARVSAEDINFMAKHARGLICLTLSRERCKQLNLPLMVGDNGSPHGTNFTVSIEAAEGVSTGISAADRARTVQAAVAPNASARDIVQPGHIFPLMAQPGGVLSRAGHTEAGCDLARLAGYEPAAVIVEVMNDDGTMARRADLEEFGRQHDIKIGTIADLIHHRMAHEKTVECVKTRMIETEYGAFQLHTYRDESRDQYHHAIVKGDINPETPTLVRVHMPNQLRDFLSLVEPERDKYPRWTFLRAMEQLARAEEGVIILLNADSDLSGRSREEELEYLYGERPRQSQPGSEHIQFQQVGVGSQILRELGVKKIRLMGPPIKYAGLSGFDLEVVDFVTPEL